MNRLVDDRIVEVILDELLDLRPLAAAQAGINR